jgi:hypothetical protein
MMGPRHNLHNISSGRAATDDKAGRAAAGRPAYLLPAGAAFDPPANSTPAGNPCLTCSGRGWDLIRPIPGIEQDAYCPDCGGSGVHAYDLETALPGGDTCVTCWYWKPTVGNQCEACADDTEARS